MFGVANQLLAAIAFGVGTVIIVKAGKLKYAWVTFVPMLFMFTTTFTASWQLIGIFRDKAAAAVSQAEATMFKIDAFLVFFLAALAVIVLLDMLYSFYRYLSGSVETVREGAD
jgi:carbon starvation protein